MKFQNPLLLLAALVSCTSAREADVRTPSHPRDLLRENPAPILAARGEDSEHLHKRAPQAGSSADATVYVYVRREPISKYVDGKKGLDHSGYNDLMTRICAQHIDLVVTAENSWYELGLGIRRDEKEWLKDNPNAEGEKVVGYFDTYKPVPNEQLEPRGALPAGWTIDHVKKLSKSSPYP